MGLANLPYVNEIIRKRKVLMQCYDKMFFQNGKLKAIKPKWHTASENNGAYYPVVLESEELLLRIKSQLESSEIGTRRYFYPSLATLPYLNPRSLPITDNIAKKVLCLPFYYDLSEEEVMMIGRLILRIQNN
jgi:dTDP-4-amino-4,6-dideoxygalactose transaminase